MVTAVVIVGVALVTGNDSSAETRTARGATTPLVGFHVGVDRCDDAHTETQARDPATPWCSIARAAALVPAGSTVLIQPGTYAGPSVGPSSAQGLTLRAADPARPPVVHGVRLKRVDGYRVTGLQLDGGIGLRGVRHVTIEGNTLVGGGIYVRQSADVTLSSNRIRRLRGVTRGIMLQGSYAAGARTNERIRVVGNRISDTDHDAIGVYNGYRDILVANNRIADVHQPGKDFKYHSDGLQLMAGAGAVVEGNVFQDVTHGIIVKDGGETTGLVIRRNLIVRVGGAALQLFNARGTVIDRNTFWAALLGVVLGDPKNEPGSTTARLDNNVLQDVSVRVRGAVTSATGNVIGRGRPVGRRAYRGRPRFIDPARGDYRLRSTNPGAGIRRGTTVPGAQQRARP